VKSILLTTALILVFALGLGCGKKPEPQVELEPTDEAEVETASEEEASEEASGDLSRFDDLFGSSAEEAEPVAPPPPVIVMEDVHFEFDKYTLTAEARRALAAIGKQLKANPDTRLTIEGHCDERGSQEYNLALGQRRAQAAKDYLVNLGVGPGQLSIISYGEERPLDPRSNEEAWAKNRRAHFKER
jgi:peptidoglycan-associated lipoprotein